MTRPIGEDLVALVPSGVETLFDIDVEQLRAWEQTERVLGLLPPSMRARLARLGPHWISDIDGVVIGLWHGEHGPDSVMIMRGDLPDEKLPALLEGAATKGMLGMHAIFDSDGGTVLRIGPRLVAVGSSVEVRRVAEVLSSETMGLRDAPVDKPLREALALAPTAKTGRPAVIGAAVAGPLLDRQLDDAAVGTKRPSSASLAVAVGDGVDAVLVLVMPSVSEASALRLDIDRALRDLKANKVVRLFQLGAAFDFVTVARERQVRIAYRIAGPRLDAFLDRMEQGQRAIEEMNAAPKPKP